MASLRRSHDQPSSGAAQQQQGVNKKKVVRWREWVSGWCTVLLATAKERPGTAAGVAVGEGRER